LLANIKRSSATQFIPKCSAAPNTWTATQLDIHAKQELDHALIISRQIDYLGKMPAVTPKPVRASKDPKEILRYDLENENETIRNYRDRIRQCETLGEFAMAEQIRQILVQEQNHQIDLATALGEEVPDLSGGPKDAPWASGANAARVAQRACEYHNRIKGGHHDQFHPSKSVPLHGNTVSRDFAKQNVAQKEKTFMPTITTRDGAQIYYKDWGKGQPIVFSHGWPLTADDWDGQMLFFGQQGYRVIAHDRRGHGRST
jgi:Ferritin-like domain